MTIETKQRVRTTFAMSAIASAALIAGSIALPAYSSANNATNVQPLVTVPETGFADLIALVEPAVVTIEVDKIVQPQLSGFNGDPRSEQFLERFFGSRGMSPPQPDRVQGAGSGFLIDDEGYIVTNNHVIANAERVSIRLPDDRQFTAEVVGVDDKTDLALLKIEADNLTAIDFGNSDAMRVGDWVVAIGNPFGLGGTATVGIISARSRDIRSGPYDDYLQIDAPINMGNSGGPIFNTSGQVVGVNTAIFSPNGGSVGIGFAIPANQVKEIVAELKSNGKVDRGWLGVQLQDIDQELADGLGLESQSGALIADVVADSAAAHAGVEVGDVVLSYNGQEVLNAKSLSRIVGSSDGGDKVTLGVLRGEDNLELEVILGDMVESAKLAGNTANAQQELKDLGLALSPMTDELRNQLGVDSDTSGAVVVNIDPNGLAARKGLRRGDVLVKAGGAPIDGPNDLEKALKTAKKLGRKSVPILVKRGDSQQFSTLPVG
jgi:serine protease Do